MMREPSFAESTIGDSEKRRGHRAGDRGPVGSLKKLVPYLKPYVGRIALAAVALIVASGTVLVLGQGLKLLVDQGFGPGDGSLLDRAVLALLGLVALLAVAGFGRFYLVSWIGERVVADLRKDVFAQVLRQSPGFFEVTRTGEVLSRLTTDTTLVQVVVGTSVSIALRNALMLLGATGLMLVTSPKLTGIVALIVPIVVIPIILIGRRVRALSRASQDRVADVGAEIDEQLTGIRIVQAFGHEPVTLRRFGSTVESSFAVALERIRARAGLGAIVMLLVFGAISMVLWLGGHAVIDGRMSPGDLSAFVFYAAVAAGSVGALGEVAGDLQRAAGALERLIELMETPPMVTAPPEPTHLPNPARGALAFEQVRFRYPARPDQAALDGLDFAVAPGERVALVGPSGAGKTTVFQLLLRFYDPDDGIIRLDGVPLRDAIPSEVRARIGLVPQDPVIFSASAAENIRYGKPDATDDEVQAAAVAAQAHDFIAALPDGYASHLGEKGVRLSGGQRQRIAIARAVLRDPQVLLLDEATSALDAESERAVQTALEELMKGRTSLVIAHRLATVVAADRILVLDQGRLVAAGSHAALMNENGLYARLARLQFDAAETMRVSA